MASEKSPIEQLNESQSAVISARDKFNQISKGGENLVQQMEALREYKAAVKNDLALAEKFKAKPTDIQKIKKLLDNITDMQRDVLKQMQQQKWENAMANDGPAKAPSSSKISSIAQDETLEQGASKPQKAEKISPMQALKGMVNRVEDTVRNAKSKAQAKQAMKNFKIDAPIDRSSFDSEDYDSQSSRSRSSSSSSPTTPRFTRGK